MPSPSKRLIPLTETAFTGIAHGPIAETKLKQVFRFTREQCSHTIEAANRFALPGDAAFKEIQVAGLHRASPSASLDKSSIIMLF